MAFLFDVSQAPQCLWTVQGGSQYRIRVTGTRNGDDCTLVTVEEDYEPQTGGGDGSTVALDASAIFDYPSVPTALSLYSLFFAAIVGPALIAFAAKRIIQALNNVG